MLYFLIKQFTYLIMRIIVLSEIRMCEGILNCDSVVVIECQHFVQQVQSWKQVYYFNTQCVQKYHARKWQAVKTQNFGTK